MTLRLALFANVVILLLVQRRCVGASAELEETSQNACDVYLAPSTIPGAGLGMFAGRKFKRRERVTKGDVAIPLSEIDWHNGFLLKFFLWEEYTWSARTFTAMDEETVSGGVQGCSPGIGAAINCDLPLVNLEDTWSEFDGAGLHRSKDPGAGAFTPFHNRETKAKKEIQAGQELYIDYGEKYFSSRERIYGKIPFKDNYSEADNLLDTYVKIRRSVEVKMNDDTKSQAMFEDLWEIVTNFDSRTINALPSNHSRVDELQKMGTRKKNYFRSIRDLDWLEEHGQCMTNIRPGKSKMRQAGRGAFADRFIPKGGLVAPAPLIHIGNRSQLIMYDLLPENTKGKVRRDINKPNHHQLLLNYCFGHQNSTLLLSPYGLLTSLINHSRERANTRIVWSSDMRHPEWRDMPVTHFENTKYSGLQFDFVALRDIQPNEEILIDYGVEWDDAWEEHVANWKPPRRSKNYVLAGTLDKDENLIVKTVEEGGVGRTIVQHCHEEYRLMQGVKPMDEDKTYYCRAIKRYEKNGETLYNVEVFQLLKNKKICYEKITDILFGVPRDIFYFEDEHYTRDHQMPWSFRHPMMIPDDMFPEAWMNIE